MTRAEFAGLRALRSGPSPEIVASTGVVVYDTPRGHGPIYGCITAYLDDVIFELDARAAIGRGTAEPLRGLSPATSRGEAHQGGAPRPALC